MIQARCLPQVHLVSISYIARSAVLITSTVTLPPSRSPLKYHEPPGRCARGGAPSPEEKPLHTWVHPITLAMQGFHVSSPDFSIWEEDHRGHATCSPAMPRGLTAGWGLAWLSVTHQGGACPGCLATKGHSMAVSSALKPGLGENAKWWWSGKKGRGKVVSPLIAQIKQTLSSLFTQTLQPVFWCLHLNVLGAKPRKGLKMRVPST